MTKVGLDVGGANLKLFTDSNHHRCLPFALWKHPNQLDIGLKQVTSALLSIDQVRITMTGELADGFSCKKNGVEEIVRQCVEFFSTHYSVSKENILFYHMTGGWVGEQTAIDDYLKVAAGNWHLSARFLAKELSKNPNFHNRKIVWIDTGSTTTDLQPIVCNEHWSPAPAADLERMVTGRLVYQGFERTPINFVVQSIFFEDQKFLLAPELFATAKDAYLVAKMIPADPQDQNTADGSPFTFERSLQRLARLFCSDPDELPTGLIRTLAGQFIDQQRTLIVDSIDRMVSFKDYEKVGFCVSGAGQAVLEAILRDHFSENLVIEIGEIFQPDQLNSFPSFAAVNWR